MEKFKIPTLTSFDVLRNKFGIFIRSNLFVFAIESIACFFHKNGSILLIGVFASLIFGLIYVEKLNKHSTTIRSESFKIELNRSHKYEIISKFG